MDDVQILVHIQAVRAARAVDLMAAVIHGKADQRVMLLPMLLDQLAEHGKRLRIGTKLGQRLDAFGSEFVHFGIVISVINRDKVVLVGKDQLCRLGIDLLAQGRSTTYCNLFRLR